MKDDDKIIGHLFFNCQTDSTAEADFLINEGRNIKEEKKEQKRRVVN